MNPEGSAWQAMIDEYGEELGAELVALMQENINRDMDAAVSRVFGNTDSDPFDDFDAEEGMDENALKRLGVR